MKKAFLPLMVFLIVALALSSCSSSAQVSNNNSVKSSDRNIAILDQKIENLKDTMTLAFASMDEYYIARTTKLRAQLDRIEADNDMLIKRSENLVGVIDNTNAYLRELNNMPIFFGAAEVIADETVASMEDIPKDRLEEVRVIKPEVVVPEIQVQKIVRTDPFMDKYKEALNKFYYQRYGDAIEIFESLVSEQPKHYLIGNIQYWVGESYYALHQYKKALNAFNQVFDTNAFDKYDDTQLKLGFCYFKMGKMRSAIVEFQNLLTYYPNSEHVSIAIRQIGIIEQYAIK
ncbi:MAG: tetratricopeptide repeat protein [Candidatus Neomarinimicrobiota bacterium]